jgi:biopolymer transport protein ExbB
MGVLSQSIDYGVVGLLIVMSIVAIGIALERWLFYRQVRIEMYDNKRALELALTKKLHLIATVGSNAPYIGLLGTVLGIMLTFSTMGAEGLVDSGKIMSGLSMALKATALGLVVAIPAVTLYNLLLRHAKELLMQWDIRHGREGV